MLSWLTGKPKSNLPEPTALQTQRTKQIEQLKTFNQNVVELKRDVEYKVTCTAGGSPLSLHITLPPQFPQEKPTVRTVPRVNHPWINNQGQVIGCTSLNNFVVHSDLGKVIKEIVEEFQRNPPTPQHHYGVGYPGYPANPPGPGQPPTLPYTPYPVHPPPASTGGYMAGSVPMPTLPPTSGTALGAAAPSVIGGATTLYPGFGNMAPQLPTGAVGSYMMPPIPTNFAHLNDLSTAELRDLAEDEGKLIEFLRGLPELKKVSRDQQKLFEQNEKSARENLSKRPHLEEQKRLLLEKYDWLNELRRRFDENAKHQDDLRQQFNPQSLQDNLKVAAMQAEEESESIAEKFLEGEITVEEFKKKYMQSRTKSHLRRAKEEKLSQFGV